MRCTRLLQPSSGSSWIESTEIRVSRTRRLNLESFSNSKTTFYTTLPFRNLMSFQRHLFAQDRSRPHYSGPFYLWRSACLPLPSSYVTQTAYLYATSSPWPYLHHTVTWPSPMPYTRGQVLTEHVVRGGQWQFLLAQTLGTPIIVDASGIISHLAVTWQKIRGYDILHVLSMDRVSFLTLIRREKSLTAWGCWPSAHADANHMYQWWWGG